MKAVNRFIKGIWYIGLYLMALFESYVIALLMVSILASVICAVWSFITPLPSYISTYYGVLLLQGAIPVGVGLSIYIMKISIK